MPAPTFVSESKETRVNGACGGDKASLWFGGVTAPHPAAPLRQAVAAPRRRSLCIEHIKHRKTYCNEQGK